ncbi:hypothetical protein [Nocardia sp. NPDC006630]|uniref:TRADD-N-associated membrane domain-containing protein n=1 Tax=Nocardia sp. NPDC006630 TaxID=3157181 RepID=UPI0033A37214
MSFETVVSATVFSVAVVSTAAGLIGVTLSRATRQQAALEHARQMAQVIVDAGEPDADSVAARPPWLDGDATRNFAGRPGSARGYDHQAQGYGPLPQQPEYGAQPEPSVWGEQPGPPVYGEPPQAGQPNGQSIVRDPGGDAFTFPRALRARRPAGRQLDPNRRSPSNVDNLQIHQYFDHIDSARSQSAIYFWTYLLSGLLGICVLLTAAAIAIFGSRDVAIFTTICGALPTAISAMFYKRAGDLDKVVQDNLARLDRAVETSKRMKAAKGAAERMPAGQERERMLSLIAIRQMFPDATPADIAALLPQIRREV